MPDRPLRILIPILGFGRAGGNRVLSELANAWVRRGADVTFLTAAVGPAPYFPTSANILRCDRHGVFHAAPIAGRDRGAEHLISLWRGLRAIHRDYDVVLANHSLTTWPISLAGVPRGKRYYYIQAYEPDYYSWRRAPLQWALAFFSYRLGFRQIVNSPTYPGRPHRPVVPFGIDAAVFARRPDRPFSDPDQIVLGTIGRSEPGKGTRLVLDAFAQLHAGDPRFRLRVAYGNLPADWAHPAVEVVVPGNDRELADFYRSVDILVTGCYGQTGAPHYPVLEAMACGTPVVTAGYLPATAENAWLSRERDVDSIVQQVRAAVAAPDRARRLELARRAAECYGWGEVAGQMYAVFKGQGR